MQTAFGKIFIFLMLLGSWQSTTGQTRLRFETPDGFEAKSLNVRAWTSFGIDYPAKFDSLKHEYLFYKNINRISASGEGYLTLDTIIIPEVELGSSLVFIIKPEEQIMDEALVSVSRSDIKVKHSSVSISVVKPYLIENRISTDAGQVLEQVPGVNVADNQINIRNGNGWSFGAGSRVMVLADGLPLLSPDAQSAQLTFIPMENVESIEIVKSAGSVLYGSSALNGVVHIRTAEAGLKMKAKASAYSGFYGSAPVSNLNWSPKTRTVNGSNGFFSQRFKNTAVTVSYNVLNNQGYRLNEFDNRGRISLRLKQHNQKVEGLNYGANISAQTGKNGTFLLWHSYAQGYTPKDSGFNKSDSKKLTIDPFIHYTGKRIAHLFQARYFAINNAVDNGDPQNDQSNGSSIYYGEYRISSSPSNKHITLSSGLVAMHSETHSALYSGSQKSQNLAAYVEANLKLKRLKAQAGGRYEHYKLNKFEQSKPVFRIGANYALSAVSFLRASWGQGFRFPSMAEAFITTSTSAVSIYPNPNLLPETGDNFETGLRQGFKIGKFRGYADAGYFKTRYRNLMEFTFAQWFNSPLPPFGLGFKSVNISPVKISGFEIETGGFGKIQKYDIKLLAGYTYTNPISLFPDSSFAKNASNQSLTYENTRADSNNYLKYRFKHLMRIDLQVDRANWEAGMSVRYSSAMLNMDDAFVTLISPDIETAWKSLGSYTVVDFRVAWKVKKQFKINAQVQNLFNTLYLSRPADLRPPRSFQLQVVWSLE